MNMKYTDKKLQVQGVVMQGHDAMVRQRTRFAEQVPLSGQ